MDEWAEGLWRSLLFLAACELHLRANADCLEADRIEARNPPWARFLRRRAGRMADKARKLAPGVYDGDWPPHNSDNCG